MEASRGEIRADVAHWLEAMKTPGSDRTVPRVCPAVGAHQERGCRLDGEVGPHRIHEVEHEWDRPFVDGQNLVLLGTGLMGERDAKRCGADQTSTSQSAKKRRHARLATSRRMWRLETQLPARFGALRIPFLQLRQATRRSAAAAAPVSRSARRHHDGRPIGHRVMVTASRLAGSPKALRQIERFENPHDLFGRASRGPASGLDGLSTPSRRRGDHRRGGPSGRQQREWSPPSAAFSGESLSTGRRLDGWGQGRGAAYPLECGGRWALSRQWRRPAPGRWRSRAGPARLWRVARIRRRDPCRGG